CALPIWTSFRPGPSCHLCRRTSVVASRAGFRSVALRSSEVSRRILLSRERTGTRPDSLVALRRGKRVVSKRALDPRAPKSLLIRRTGWIETWGLSAERAEDGDEQRPGGHRGE